MQNARVLDVFAGTGAFGLEALSRGAAFCTFIENAPPAVAALRANVTACRAVEITRIITADALRPPAGTAHDLLFMDPPYGLAMVPAALAALAGAGWLAPAAVCMAELGPDDEFAPPEVLAERRHGKARLVFWRHPG
jgi:16S rRNA (guanine966-N2)-methyltransferase